jgi:hypothetical protein
MSEGLLGLYEQVCENATDTPITVWLPGCMVTGALTAAYFFDRWRQEVWSRAALGEGRFRLPSVTVRDPTLDERAAAAASWKERMAGDQVQEPLGPPVEDPSFTLTFRNASVLQHGEWTSFPFMAVESNQIHAWAIGEISQPEPPVEPL